MKVLTDIFKIVGACSVLSVFGCVIYLLAFETWQAWKSARATKEGIRRLQEIAERSMAEGLAALRTGGVYDHDLEQLWNLEAREPRRSA